MRGVIEFQRETYIEWIEMSSRPLLCGVVIEFICAGVGLDSFNLFSSPFRRGDYRIRQRQQREP